MRPAMSASIDKPKLLFIVSNDFGELSYVLQFITGQPFEVLIAMPQRLFDSQAKCLPYQTKSYESLADLQRIIEDQQAQIVFLYCGYLYTINNLLTLEELKTLLAGLARQNCPVLTSDPFLGLILETNDQTFSEHHPHKEQLSRHFALLAEKLAKIAHIYPVHVEGPLAKSYSFFNKHIVEHLPTLRDLKGLGDQSLPLLTDRQRWLFILSSEDYALQVNQRGIKNVQADIVKKLRETVAQGRQPMIIAPQPLVDSLTPLAAEIEGLAAIPFCDIILFQHLLLEAEIVFYWNILSNSILLRVFNNRPIFFFSLGHTAKVIPKLYDLAQTWYYSKSTPPFLDPQESLDSAVLLEKAAGQGKVTERMRKNFYNLPSPADLVGKLLHN